MDHFKYFLLTSIRVYICGSAHISADLGVDESCLYLIITQEKILSSAATRVLLEEAIFFHRFRFSYFVRSGV